MKQKIIKEIISWAIVIVIAVLIATFINKVILLNVKVPSGSMEPTIMTGDKVVNLRLSYLFGDPKRGDIVVFPLPDDESIDYIKRIIGLPGETIEGKDGIVYINDEPLDEPYVDIDVQKFYTEEDFGPYEIPEDCYFMMGDNRRFSEDARFWDKKFVERDKIKGKALFKLPNFRWLN